MEQWLVTMSLRSGEYEQPFKKLFEVKDQDELYIEIDDYLAGHSTFNKAEGGVYYYNGGEVACKYEQSEKIESFEQLINALK